MISASWAGGSTRQWRRVRAAVLARDANRCQVQTDACTTIATCVHHLDGRSVTGDDPSRLVASCTPCNLKLGDVRTNDPQPRPTKWWEKETP